MLWITCNIHESMKELQRLKTNKCGNKIEEYNWNRLANKQYPSDSWYSVKRRTKIESVSSLFWTRITQLSGIAIITHPLVSSIMWDMVLPIWWRGKQKSYNLILASYIVLQNGYPSVLKNFFSSSSEAHRDNETEKNDQHTIVCEEWFLKSVKSINIYSRLIVAVVAVVVTVAIDRFLTGEWVKRIPVSPLSILTSVNLKSVVKSVNAPVLW